MNTETEEPQTKSETFHFDDNGRCTNPERVRVPMPNGVICHLLVAQAPWEGWFGGYAIGGRTLKVREAHVVDTGAGKADSRDEAIGKAAAALEAALDAANDQEWACAKALRDFMCGGELSPTIQHERIEVASPEGTSCELFVHPFAADSWGFGFSVHAPTLGVKSLHVGEKPKSCPPSMEPRKPSRELAIKEALVLAYDACITGEAFELSKVVLKYADAYARETDPWLKPKTVVVGDAAEDIAPAPNKSGFQFNEDGHCTNPERVFIPCPEGFQCALLVAQMADGTWTFGAERGGVMAADSHVSPAELIANGVETREDALEAALIVALEIGEPGSVLNVALEEWRAAQAAEQTAEVEKKIRLTPAAARKREKEVRAFVEQGHTAIEIANVMGLSLTVVSKVLDVLGFEGAGPWGEVLAFEGRAEGRCIEFPTRDDAQEWINGQKGRKGFLDYAVRIGVNGKLFDVVYRRKEATPGQGAAVTGEMPTSAATEAEAPAAPVLPGMAHEANESGVFENAERVTVPMPKRAACEIQLACDAEGRWVYGLTLQLPSCGRGAPASVGGDKFPGRAEALAAGLKCAREFFSTGGNATISAAEKKIADRAAEAVERFMAVLPGMEEPAAPVVRVAPIYRTEFMELLLAKIQENPENDRKAFNVVKDRELADSLLTEGLHQPIAVRKLLDGETPEGEFALGDASAPEYELIFGHRRRRAGIMAGLATLQAKVYHGLARKQATAIALIENLQREGLNAMEEAEGYARLMRDEELTQDACAARVGRARSTVANAVGLLRLPEVIREYIREGKLTAEHGKGLKRFVPDATDGERWRAEFPGWESVVKIMAERAIETKAPSSELDRGIPFIHTLTNAGVAVRIDQFGEHRVNGKHREHAAYFPVGDGDWVCFNPPHWQAEVTERVRREQERVEAERRRQEETLAALAKGGRKQLRIADLKAEDYRELKGVNEGLVDLVPDDKKQAAKGDAGRTTVITDVQLADRLQRAMLKEIKANRIVVGGDIEAKARKKIASLKKVSPRELAWLVFMLVDPQSQGRRPILSEEAHKEAGVKFAQVPRGALAAGAHECEADQIEYQARRLPALGKSDPVSLVRVLMTEYLQGALADVVANGAESLGGRVLKWWLDTDTLWLLEETAEGRAEIVERVKTSAWYAKAIAGVAGEGEES